MKDFRHFRAGGNPVAILVLSTVILTLRVVDELDSRLRGNDVNGQLSLVKILYFFLVAAELLVKQFATTLGEIPFIWSARSGR